MRVNSGDSLRRNFKNSEKRSLVTQIINLVLIWEKTIDSAINTARHMPSQYKFARFVEIKVLFRCYREFIDISYDFTSVLSSTLLYSSYMILNIFFFFSL